MAEAAPENVSEFQGSDDLKEVFKMASSYVRGLKNVDDEVRLQFYGLYKQVLDGKCNISKPPFWDFVGKAKWEAWKKLGDLSEVDAMIKYVALVDHVEPDWKDKVASNSNSGGTQTRGMGVAVSKMANQEEESISDDKKSAFDWCKEGDLVQLQSVLLSDNVNLNQKDDQGMTLLHWAADRGHDDIIHFLITNKVDLNTQDVDLQTALHYAVVCEHKNIVSQLVQAGADTSIEDSDGQTPADCADSEEMKELLLPQR